MADPIHYRYDTFSPRIAATIIDALIVFVPAILLQTLVGMVSVFWFGFFAILFTTIAVRAYFILGHGLYGRTVGKKTQNVRVVDFTTEQPISMLQAFRRELLFLILIVIVLTASALVDFVPITDELTLSSIDYGVMVLQLAFFTVQIVYCLSNPKRRSLHDLIGGTVVVRDNVPLVLAASEN